MEKVWLIQAEQMSLYNVTKHMKIKKILVKTEELIPMKNQSTGSNSPWNWAKLVSNWKQNMSYTKS